MSPQATPAPPVAPPPPDLAALVKRIGDVSTLPGVAQRVIEVAGQPSAGAADLRFVLESDPALSARLLRCINSATYGLRSRVTNLQLAISYLGFKEVRNLALAASVAQVFREERQIGTYRRTTLWRHLIAVAVTARMIARRVRMANFEEAFLAGLLHDIGIVLEDQYCHERFEEMMLTRPADVPLIEIEQRVLGFDHTQLGCLIAEGWSFPEPVTAAIRHHHACQDYQGDALQVVCAVELANIICTLKGIPSIGQSTVRPTALAMNRLGLGREDVKVLADDLDHQLELSKELFVL